MGSASQFNWTAACAMFTCQHNTYMGYGMQALHTLPLCTVQHMRHLKLCLTCLNQAAQTADEAVNLCLDCITTYCRWELTQLKGWKLTDHQVQMVNPPRGLKELKTDIAGLLAELMWITMQEHWKTANMILIFKKGSEGKQWHYGLVSLMAVLVKWQRALLNIDLFNTWKKEPCWRTISIASVNWTPASPVS